MQPTENYTPGYTQNASDFMAQRSAQTHAAAETRVRHFIRHCKTSGSESIVRKVNARPGFVLTSILR